MGITGKISLLFLSVLLSCLFLTGMVSPLRAAVTIENEIAAEGGGMTFTATSDTAIPFTVDVVFGGGTAIGGGTDYDDSLQTLTFVGGIGETQPFTVPLLDDSIVESSEFFNVTLQNVSDGSIDISDTAIGTITDADTATVSIGDVSVLESGVMTFTVGVDNAVAGGFTVDATFSDGAATGGSPLAAGFDYDNATQTLAFSGAVGESQVFTVDLQDDDVDEPVEDFQVSFSNLFSIEAPVAMFDYSDTATGTILNDDHLITMSTDHYGLITGPGSVSADGSAGSATGTVIVDHNSQPVFSLQPTDTCYHIVDVQANGTSVGAVSSYTFPPVVTEDNTLNLAIAITEYTVTTTVLGNNGTVTPGMTLDCAADSTDIMVEANENYHITWVKVDGVEVKGADDFSVPSVPYTVPAFMNMTADHTVEAAFSQMITIREFSPFGEISPVGTGKPAVLELPYGASQTFNILAADPCPEALAHGAHHISDILIDGTVVLDSEGNPVLDSERNEVYSGGISQTGVYGLGSYTYIFSNITENHTIEVLFTSFVDVLVHGSGAVEEIDSGFYVISPATTEGIREVAARTSPDFIFTPAEGYHVAQVLVDGTDVGKPGHYVFTDMVDDDHTLEITFSLDNFVVEPVSTFDTIFTDTDETVVATEQSVPYNGTITFYVNLNDPDHSILGVLIDNVIVTIPGIDASDSYGDVNLSNVGGGYLAVEFTAVQASHRLEVRDYDTTPLADVPMDVKLRPNPASIMFLMDDSGSMDWEISTSGEVPGAGWHNNYYVFDYPASATAYDGAYSLSDQNREDKWPSQWGMVNKMYYQPEEVYVPWPMFEGAANNLPAVAADDQAHANIYRPRYHPWHNQDCAAALTKEAGGDPTVVLAGCNENDTFDMDATFIVLGGDAVDDHGGSMAEATPISGNSSFQATIDPSREHDYFRIELTGSGDLLVRTLMTDECTDMAGRILDANGAEYRTADYSATNIYYYSVDGGSYADDCGSAARCDQSCSTTDRNPYIYLENVPAGTYYIDIRAWSTRTGTYTLDVAFSGTSDDFELPVVGERNIINAHYFTWNKVNPADTISYDDGDGDGDLGIGEDVYSEMWLVNLTYPIQYYKVLDNTADTSDSNLELVAIEDVPPGVQTYNTIHHNVIPANSGGYDAYFAERQNWADWFSYYRKRTYAATAATARAIDKMSGMNIGFRTINYEDNGYVNGGYGFSQAPLPVNVFGKEDQTKELLKMLYAFQIDQYGTPLRNGLKAVGEFFDDTDSSYGNVCQGYDSTGNCIPGVSPYHSGSEGDECKQVFTIAMTDGYYNGDNPNIGGISPYNIDGDDGPPYADNSGNSLADVAMYFYERDLSTIENLVPDDVPWQHMVTYTVAFGVKGALDPDEYDFDEEEYPDWPPVSQNEHRVDDLWHAAVNGHGQYLNVDTPSELVQALLDIMDDIVRRIGSGASVSVNGDELYESISGKIRMFQTSYNSGDWSGDIVAHSLTEQGVLVSSNVWSADATLTTLLGADGSGHSARTIATYNGTEGKPFLWGGASNLSSVQQKLLEPYFAPSLDGSDVLDYLRGDKSNEGTLRVREKSLGDFVNSLAVFHGYQKKDSFGNLVDDNGDALEEGEDPVSEGVLFVGGNAGMLHAFMADDESAGAELFAYVPGAVYQNLRELSNPLYKHKFFVDNTPYVLDVSDALTMLVGGLGKGGKGYYALDVSNATSAINSETDLAGRVMWEFPAVPAPLYSGSAVTFTVGSGAGGGDVVHAPGLEFKDLLAGDSIRIAGASCGAATNDGEYRIVADAATDGTGGSSVELLSGSLVSGCGNGQDVIILPNATPGLGYSFSRPLLVKTNDPNVGSGDLAGYVVLFGNGYDSDTGTASLYILDPDNGTVLRHIETGVGPFNGLSTPKVIDPNNNFKADYVYAGDLLGNMWKFDLTSSDHEDWQVAFCEGGNTTDHCKDTVFGMIPKPLFGAMGNQPITATPDIMFHQYGPGYMVIFGTGKFLGVPDLEYYTTQSIYGIWDWAEDDNDTGYLGVRVDDTSVSPIISHLSNAPVTDVAGDPVNTLLRQEILWEGIIIADTDGSGVQNDLEEAFYYRIPTNYEGDWSVSDGVPQGNLGWVVDLPGKLDLDGDGLDNDSDGFVDEEGEHLLGERVVNDTIIRDNKAIVISFLPTTNSCGAGAYSFLNERNANTGGMLYAPAFDLNGDGNVDWDDVTDPLTDGILVIDLPIPTDIGVEGRLFNPVILRETEPGDDTPEEKKYLSSSTGAIEIIEESAEKRGVYFWQQVE